jgi:type II secretory pathway pseudopilin PulG
MSSSHIMTRINQKGITLVELTVTVAVLILVAAFILPRWFSVARNSEVTIFRSNITIINAAAAAHLSETHRPAASLASLVDEGYLDELPACTSGREYSFNGYYVDNVCDRDH